MTRKVQDITPRQATQRTVEKEMKEMSEENRVRKGRGKEDV